MEAKLRTHTHAYTHAQRRNLAVNTGGGGEGIEHEC